MDAEEDLFDRFSCLVPSSPVLMMTPSKTMTFYSSVDCDDDVIVLMILNLCRDRGRILFYSLLFDVLL
jgi:hypothetical protein